MTIELTWAKVSPYLSTKAVAQQVRTEPWLAVLQVLLNNRYGEHITVEPDGGNEAAFVSYAADAVNRRVKRPADAEFVAQQSIGPASVRYNDRAAISRWFEPEEISDMDALTGTGTINSTRTPAPDGIRYGNRLRRIDDPRYLNEEWI